jgi:hypothetical protein
MFRAVSQPTGVSASTPATEVAVQRLKLGCPGILGRRVGRTSWSRPRPEGTSYAVAANVTQVINVVALPILSRLYFQKRTPVAVIPWSAGCHSHCRTNCGGLEHENADHLARALLFYRNPSHDGSDRQTFKFIQTAFGSVKLSIAAVPCSRPSPESRSPPQGNRTSV